MMKHKPERSYRPFGLLAEMTYRCPLHCPTAPIPRRPAATNSVPRSGYV
ncbi:MAG: hypothetical protein ACRDHW_09555 [Ktedonobacteraceae bacterium]